MTPQFRFTMYHPTVSAGGTVVVQPLGWKDASISLTRDPKFHSLVEYFKGSFIWYGNARQFIRDVEDIGPDEQLRVLIELYFSTWVTLFDGLIEISQLEDLSKKESFYKIQAPIIRNDFWAKFINRMGTSINLQATVDLEGNARTAVNKITLPQPGQILNKRTSYFGSQAYNDSDTGTSFSGRIQIGFEKEFDNIDDTFVIPFLYTTGIPEALVKIKELGDVTVTVDGDIHIIITADQNVDSVSASISRRLNLAAEAGIDGDTLTPGTTSVDEIIPISGTYTFTGLVIDDEIKVYGTFAITLASSGSITYEIGFENLRILFEQATVYQDTTTDAYLLKDAAESLLSKITGNDGVLVSNVLDTCYGLNAILRGKHNRGLLFANGAFTMSFDEWWSGAEPILNLGLGYTSNANEIEIEKKDEFYDPSPVVFIPNVSDLVRKYDQSKYIKDIEIGYNKWSTESDDGIDDPQTLRKYRTKFTTIGEEFSKKSNFYAASLGIEKARRNRIADGKDDSEDEDILIINVKPDGENYTPVLGTDFNAVTNLLNSSSRYNIRHSCARMLKRWQKFLQGCLSHTTGEYFYFSGGEGNYKMTSQFETTDCESTDDPEPTLAEDQDIAVDETNFDFIPKLYTAKVPMSKSTYDTILANRKKAIGISQTTVNFLPMHIIDFDYKIMGGYAELELLLASDITVTPEGFILQEDGNMILMEDGTSGILIE